MVTVAVIGSDGRTHSIGHKLGQSDEVDEVLYFPGNGGTQEGKGRNMPADGTLEENFNALADVLKSEHVYFAVVSPEVPLAAGLVNRVNEKGYNKIFGPTQAAIQLETDKFFSCDLMRDKNIPQANYVKCYTTEEAIRTINERATEDGIVIKARGLTEGKGVTVCDSKQQALEEIVVHKERFAKDKPHEVLIAERLFGKEFSVFGIAYDNEILPWEMAFQDYKPLLEGGKGPNTGSMGSYGPSPIASPDVVRDITENMLTPIIQEMQGRGINYRGFLYAGMMMTPQGPKVLELNCRFGDTEDKPGMTMLKSDLFQTIHYALKGDLDAINLEFHPGASCCVAMASEGYPYSPKTGFEIGGIQEAERIGNVKVYHAGTKRIDGKLIATGGRVLGVTEGHELGLEHARGNVYEAVDIIDRETRKLNGGRKVFTFRRDIGNEALLA